MTWNPNQCRKSEVDAESHEAARFRRPVGRARNRWQQWLIGEYFVRVAKTRQLVDMRYRTGNPSECLLVRGHCVHGMDIMAVMLKIARRRLLPNSMVVYLVTEPVAADGART